MRLVLALLAGLACGCSAADDYGGAATDDFIDQDVPPGNCSAGTSADPCPPVGTSGSPEGGPCDAHSDCVEGTSCVAPFEGGRAGEFTCTAQCISLMDEAMWCLDDAACCDEGAVCNARGLCVVHEGGLDESGTSDGTAGGGSSDGPTSGSASTGGSGSTDGSENGSETGAATGTTGMQ